MTTDYENATKPRDGDCPGLPIGWGHCWHDKVPANVLRYSADRIDQICCWCPTDRVVLLKNMQRPGHGPNAPKEYVRP